MKSIYRDKLIAVLLVLFSLVIIYIATGFKGDSDVFPIAMAVLVILSCLPLLVAKNGLKDEEEDVEQIVWSRFVICLVLTTLFFFTIEPLGLFVSLPLYLLANYLLLARLKLVTAIAITLGLTVLVFVVFELMLEVPTPMGLLEPFLRVS